MRGLLPPDIKLSSPVRRSLVRRRILFSKKAGYFVERIIAPRLKFRFCPNRHLMDRGDQMDKMDYSALLRPCCPCCPCCPCGPLKTLFCAFDNRSDSGLFQPRLSVFPFSACFCRKPSTNRYFCYLSVFGIYITLSFPAPAFPPLCGMLSANNENVF